MQKVESRLASLIFKSIDQRIYSFIYDAAIEHGKKTEQGVEVYLRLTHENIAKLTATARPIVSAVFSDLEKRNIIEYHRKRILVKDLDALK